MRLGGQTNNISTPTTVRFWGCLVGNTLSSIPPLAPEPRPEFQRVLLQPWSKGQEAYKPKRTYPTQNPHLPQTIFWAFRPLESTGQTNCLSGASSLVCPREVALNMTANSLTLLPSNGDI